MADEPLRPLPFMKTAEDAVALCEKEGDNFYLTAFMIGGLLGEVTLQAVAEYAEKKEARDRRMQSGQAWSGFRQHFDRVSNEEFPHDRSIPICRRGFCSPAALVRSTLSPS